MGKTYIKYNDVEIRNCLLRGFTQTPVFDSSETDLMFYKFAIRVDGVIYADKDDWSKDLGVWKTGSGSQAASKTSVTVHISDIRAKMAQPRGDFEMIMGADADGSGGETLIEARHPVSNDAGKTSGYDMNNGPRCTSFSVNRVVGDNVFSVSAEFEVCTLECGFGGEDDDKNTTNVLSNRWTCADEIDANFYTTRVMSGQVRLANAVVNPHSFRHLVIPTLQPGMKRESISVTSSLDGLTLNYRVTDKEVTFSPPAPATSWEYSHTESLGENGAVHYGQMMIRLSGDRYVDKIELLTLAIDMMRQKILGVNLRNDVKYILRGFSATDTGGSNSSNSITVQADVQHVRDLVVDNVKAGFGKFGNVPNVGMRNVWDIDESPDLPNETEANIASATAFSAYLQFPCSGDHSINKTESNGGQSSGTPETAERPAIAVRSIPDREFRDPQWMSNEHINEGIYTHYVANHKYDTDQMKAALPLAQQEPASSSIPASVSFGQLAQPVGKLTVRVQAERQRKSPEMPKPEDFEDDTGIKYTLMEQKVMPHGVDLDPVGVPVYRADAEYIFVLDRAIQPDEQELNIGVIPWINHLAAGLNAVAKTTDGFLDGTLGSGTGG